MLENVYSIWKARSPNLKYTKTDQMDVGAETRNPLVNFGTLLPPERSTLEI